STDIAPLTSKRRRYPLPRLLIGPNFTLPPVTSCRGPNPCDAEKARPLRKGRRVDHDCCHGARQDRPITGRGDQMPAGRVAAPPVHDLLVNALELSLQATPRPPPSSHLRPPQRWQRRL